MQGVRTCCIIGRLFSQLFSGQTECRDPTHYRELGQTVALEIIQSYLDVKTLSKQKLTRDRTERVGTTYKASLPTRRVYFKITHQHH